MLDFPTGKYVKTADFQAFNVNTPSTLAIVIYYLPLLKLS
jgi:hypothetical protein